MNDALSILQIHNTEQMRAWLSVGESKRLVLCLSGQMQAQPPGFEFAALASGGGADHVLYIATSRRDWQDQPDFVAELLALVERVKAQLVIEQRVALGHLMGGFSACALPHFTPIDCVLALSPQVLAYPEIGADDARWATDRDRVDNFDIMDVMGYLAPATKYVVVYGRHGRKPPAENSISANLSLFTMPKMGQITDARQKLLGLVMDIRDAAFDGDIALVADLLSQGKTANIVVEERQ